MSISYKSILLESLERKEYIERNSSQFNKKWDKVDVLTFNDPLLLNERKYINIGHLLIDEKLKHLRASNLYATKKVCKN
jgi:hypothetical protein